MEWMAWIYLRTLLPLEHLAVLINCDSGYIPNAESSGSGQGCLVTGGLTTTTTCTSKQTPTTCTSNSNKDNHHMHYEIRTSGEIGLLRYIIIVALNHFTSP